MVWLGRRGQAGQGILGNLIHIIPAPVLFILFILLLSVIANLLVPVFNTMGIYCDSSGEVVKLENADLFSNIGLMTSLPSADEIGGTIVSVPNNFFNDCLQFINGSDRLYGKGCVDCTYLPDDRETFKEESWFCEGDAYIIPKANLSWWKRTTCSAYGCKIPEGYYYRSSPDYAFACASLDCSSRTLAEERNAVLESYGAVRLYPDSVDDNSVKGFFRFGCSQNLKPEITLKGIPIFNLTYWAIILLITLMLWAIINFAKKK